MTRRELGTAIGLSLILWAAVVAGCYGIWLGIR